MVAKTADWKLATDMQTLGCITYILQSVDNAATQEGVGAMVLPSNFVE